MPAPEPDDGTGCLVRAEHLALEHPTDERQRHGYLLLVSRGLWKPRREAAAQRSQLIEQERLGNTLDFNRERLTDLDEVVNARVGTRTQEDLSADRAALDASREVDGGPDHGVLGALFRADVPDDGLACADTDAHLETR